MSFELNEINSRIIRDRVVFMEECDQAYARKIERAADAIYENIKESPIVLLSGPSGSGKTTTAMKLEEVLKTRGVLTHTVAMDNYFKDFSPETVPKTPEGGPDLESPLCLDMDLLNEHFSMLSRGDEIYVPRYDFQNQRRSDKRSKCLLLGKEEIVIFEGIHALNDDITSVHPEAFKLYISARSNVENGGVICFEGTWMRLVRRLVRDNLFRGADPHITLNMWANVRRGEKNYISPFEEKADVKLDSSLPYEVSIMKNFIPELLLSLPECTGRYEKIQSIVPAFDLFESIEPELVSPSSLLREFIGGGIYKY